MRPGWNPTRRNKKIGRPGHGKKSDNRHVIPDPWWELRAYYEKLNDPVVVRRSVHSAKVTFLVEPVRRGFVYPATVDDVARVLRLLPASHLEGLKLIIFRQPTRRQDILNCVWGRLVYFAYLGHFYGPAIVLESKPPYYWSRLKKQLALDDVKELDRLREDGCQVEHDRRHYYIEHDATAVRATQLYRTVPHEVGHYVDYLRSVVEPQRATRDDRKRRTIQDRYFGKPSLDTEAFAHRYADEFRQDMKKQGRFPFDRILDLSRMQREGLRPEWFTAKCSCFTKNS